MFHEGDLQSGITLAIQQSKRVVCFVRDDSDTSNTWEDDYLLDDELVTLLHDKAVLLRMQSGSREVGFLTAFCPINQMPAVVVINVGKLEEYMTGDVSRDEFVRRIKTVLQGQGETKRPEMLTRSQNEVQEPAASQATAASTSPPNRQANQRESSPTLSESAPATKLDKGKGKASETTVDGKSAVSKPAEMSYAAQQRQKQQDARRERDRVLALIEADKEARKEKERVRRAEAAAQAAPASTPVSFGIASTSQTATRSSGQCHLQIRFFDGTSLRGSFPTTSTLSKDVRKWINTGDGQEKGGKHSPYTFKHHAPPAPARSLDIADESKTLVELGLFPSATLVLVPVQGYTAAAYGAGGANGILGAILGILNSVFFRITSALAALPQLLSRATGAGAAVAGHEEGQNPLPENADASSQGAGTGRETRSNIKLRTLADQREEERKKQHGEEWYNGNQTNFEPRKDDDDSSK